MGMRLIWLKRLLRFLGVLVVLSILDIFLGMPIRRWLVFLIAFVFGGILWNVRKNHIDLSGQTWGYIKRKVEEVGEKGLFCWVNCIGFSPQWGYLTVSEVTERYVMFRHIGFPCQEHMVVSLGDTPFNDLQVVITTVERHMLPQEPL